MDEIAILIYGLFSPGRSWGFERLFIFLSSGMNCLSGGESLGILPMHDARPGSLYVLYHQLNSVP
jgi:hypothetical protein